jgi:hypothetical protein
MPLDNTKSRLPYIDRSYGNGATTDIREAPLAAQAASEHWLGSFMPGSLTGV